MSFEAMQAMIQGGQSADDIRAALMGQDKATRAALLAHRDEGWTLFHLACQMGKLAVAFCLLELGSDVNATTPNGSTGLHFLALLGKEEAAPAAVYLQLLAELLNKGALLSLLNGSGESVLHMATSRKNDLAVGFFIDAGCDLNIQNRHGETALHYAVNQNSVVILTQLLEKGALDRPNSSLTTASDLASKGKQMDLVAVFEQFHFVKLHQSGNTSVPNLGSSSIMPQKIAKPATELKVLPARVGGGALQSSGTLSPKALLDDDIVVWSAPENDPFGDPFADEAEEVTQDFSSLSALAVNGCWETYRNDFFGKRHYVYHGSAGGEDRAIAVVLSRPSSEGVFRGLLVAGGDWNVFTFSSELLGLYASSVDEGEQIRQVLSTNKPTNGIKWNMFRNSPGVINGSLLLALEAKLALRPRICIGIVLGLTGQTKEAEMFENTSSVPEFDAFLGALGERIDVAKWRHWRGTFAANEQQEAYYCAWRGFEIVLHVSTAMDAAKQRQHIGNDTVLIYYKMGAEKVEAAFRGKVNAFALVVSPSQQQGNKSLSMTAFYRRWIEGFTPVLPHTALSITQASLLREVLFTNAINCSYAAVKSGPYKQNRLRLYDQSLNEIIATDDGGGAVGAGETEAETGPSPKKPGLAVPPLRKKVVAEKATLVTAEKATVVVVPQLDEIKAGWLMKRKGKLKKPSSWKKRYCVLRDDGMSYYERDITTEERLGVISVGQIQSVELSIGPAGLLHFSLNTVVGDYEFGSCGDGTDIRGWATILAQKAHIAIVDLSVAVPSAATGTPAPVGTKQGGLGSGPPPPRPSPRREEQPHTVANPEKLAELIEQAMMYVRKKGLVRVNIFRVVEDQTEVDALAASWERGQRTELEKEGVDIVAGAIRKYFRDQSSLLSTVELEQLVAASKKPAAEQIELARAVFGEKHLLIVLFELLNKVDEKSAMNKMGASNLAAVFAPTFLRELKNVTLLMDYTKAVVSIVQFVIQHFQCCHFKDASECEWSHSAPASADSDDGGDGDHTIILGAKEREEIFVELDLEMVERSSAARPRAVAVAVEPAKSPAAAAAADPVKVASPADAELSRKSDQKSAPSPPPSEPKAMPPVPTKQAAAPKKKAPTPPAYKAPAPKPAPRGGPETHVAVAGDDVAGPMSPPVAPARKGSRPAIVAAPAPQPAAIAGEEDDEEIVIKSPIQRRMTSPRVAEEEVCLVPALDDPFV